MYVQFTAADGGLHCKTLYICASFISLIGNFEKFAPFNFRLIYRWDFFVGYEYRNISHTYIYLFSPPFILRIQSIREIRKY